LVEGNTVTPSTKGLRSCRWKAFLDRPIQLLVSLSSRIQTVGGQGAWPVAARFAEDNMSSSHANSVRSRALQGVLIGTAVGDAIGLPFEGIPRSRLATRIGTPWRHELLLRRGMLSDDTELSFAVAQALLASGAHVERFRRKLAWRLRWWLLGLPAGIGMATMRGILRLWIGVPAHRSGVDSAGNGAAMRCGVLGVVFAHEPERCRLFVEAATLPTHRDPRVLWAAHAIATACRHASIGQLSWRELREELAPTGDHSQRDLIQSCIDRLDKALARGDSVREYCHTLGLDAEVGGYAMHSVPVALFAALRHRDNPRQAIEAVLACGGDTDTNAAMTGAVLGSLHGPDVWPESWVRGIWDFPLGVSRLRAAGMALAQERAHWRAVPYLWPLRLPRNLLFLGVVLVHGLLRPFRFRGEH
jgi:ADP-ribosyl-[dinitrogen reductase] hydrolase